MQQEAPLQMPSLGADLRALRKARGLTLAELAVRLERSVGWVSQVERDLSHPSVNDLRAIAAVLGVPLSMFFGQPGTPEGESGRVVRTGARLQIGSGDAGLVEELLSPDLTDEFEVVHSVFRPGASLPQAVQRPTTELGYMVSGRLEMSIGGRDFDLGPGDSFRIKGEPFRWANPYT